MMTGNEIFHSEGNDDFYLYRKILENLYWVTVMITELKVFGQGGNRIIGIGLARYILEKPIVTNNSMAEMVRDWCLSHIYRVSTIAADPLAPQPLPKYSFGDRVAVGRRFEYLASSWSMSCAPLWNFQSMGRLNRGGSLT